MPNIFQQITKGGLQNVISNIRDLSSQLKMTGGGSDFSLYKTIQKDYLDKYKKPSGGYDTKKFEQINKRKSEINQYVKTNPIGDRQDQGILGLYGQTELKAPHENSLLESQDRKQRWVKTQMPSIVNRLPYSELQREFPDDISILEQRYDQQELTLKKTREALALDRIRLSQQKYVTDAIYDPVTDTWKSKDFEKKTISAFEYNPNSNLHNDFIKTNELFAQSIVAGLSGYETQAYKEAMESGDFLAKFTASGGNLVGFVGALMGVGAVTRSIGFGVKTATVLSKMGLGQKAARLGAELIKSGVNFTLLGQVHSTVRGESWKEHFKSAGVDFVSGVGLTLGGMAVSKFPKLVQPLLEGSAWAGITKAQGGDNEMALIQGILFGGMRGFGLMRPSLEGVNEMTADKFLTESEKFLKAKRGDTEGIIRAFAKKTENMKPTSPEYHKAEASAVALLYPRQVFGMVKNIGSFKENRPAGLFGEGKFKEGERPGIEKAALLPEKGPLKERLEKKLGNIEEKVAEIESVRERQSGFTREEIKTIRKAKKIIDQTGDVETFANKNKEFAENLLEKISEVKGIGRDEAFEFIKDMPTAKEFTELKRSARLTQSEATKLQRRIEGSKLVKNLRDSRDLARKIKSDIIQYAKVLPLEQRGKLLAKIKNAKTSKDLNEAVEKIMELQDLADTKLYKRKINRELKGAVLKKVSGVKRGKFGAKAQAILDYVKAGRGKTIEQGQKIKLEAQQKIQENLSKFKEGEEIPESVLRENARLSLLGVEGMSPSELRHVLKVVKAVKEKGFEALFVKDFNKQAEIQRLKDVAEKEFSKGGEGLKAGEESGMDLSKKFNPIARILDRMNNFTFGLRHVVRKAAFTPKGEKGEYRKGPVEEFIGERLMDSRRVYAELNTKWYQSFVKTFADYMGVKSQKELTKVIKELSKEKVYFKGKNADGVDIEIRSYDLEAVDYYMKMRDKTLESSFDRAMKWTPEIKESISKNLPENLKNFADWLVDVHFKDIRKDVRPAYEDKFKTYMPDNPNYSPLKRKGLRPGEDTDLLFGDMFSGFASLTPSSAKTRTGVIAPIEPQNIIEMALRHHNGLARFVAFDGMVRDFNSIFKDTKIESVIRQNTGGDVYNKIIRKIDDVTRGGVDTKLVIGGVNKAIRNFAKSKLLFNVGTMIKQVTSYPVLGAKMPIVDLATGTVKFMASPQKWTKFFLKESIALQERVMNGYEKEVVVALKKGSKTLNLRGREMNLKDFAWQSMLMPTRGGDLIPVLPGMTAKYLSVSKSLKAEGKLSEAAIHKKALREAELSVLDTQQSSFVEDLSRFQLDGSFWQMMSTFGTTPIQYYRESILALREGLLTNRISKKDMAKQLALYWVVAPTLFQYVSNGFRWDESDQTRAVIFGPLNYYPAVGGLLQTMYAKTFQGEVWRDVSSSVAPVASVLNDLSDGVESTVKAIQKGDMKSWIKAFKDVYSFGATATGLPEAAPRIGIEGAYDLATDKTDNPLRLFWSGYALKEKERIGKSYEAFEYVQDSKDRILTTEEKQEITEAITKAVESGEMTEQSAKTKITNIKKNQFNVKTIQNFKEAGYSKEVIRAKLQTAYEEERITKTQAQFIMEAF